LASKINFDVIIIGPGPAGCAAAISCKMQGLQALLITGKEKKDDSKNNEDQPSESIHPGVLSILNQLKAGYCIEPASKGTYEGIAVNEAYNSFGKDEQGAWQGYHINRNIFDEAFLQTVIEQGIQVHKNDPVSDLIISEDRVTGLITTSGVKFTCQYMIDASGHKHIAAKKLKFKEKFYSPPLITWTGLSENIPAGHFLFEKNITRFIPQQSGWTWLAPELQNRCTWTRLELKGQQQFLPPAELQDYPNACKIKKSNRRWRAFRPVCKEGILLCGDAAGIIDPAAGQGILNALLSAAMAVKTIKACISNPALEAVYLARYDDWFISQYEEKVNMLKGFYAQHGIEIFTTKKM
jgi:flavin-dependent dehydrogenase